MGDVLVIAFIFVTSFFVFHGLLDLGEVILKVLERRLK